MGVGVVGMGVKFSFGIFVVCRILRILMGTLSPKSFENIIMIDIGDVLSQNHIRRKTQEQKTDPKK